MYIRTYIIVYFASTFAVHYVKMSDPTPGRSYYRAYGVYVYSRRKEGRPQRSQKAEKAKQSQVRSNTRQAINTGRDKWPLCISRNGTYRLK